jgi:hypothetical protein
MAVSPLTDGVSASILFLRRMSMGLLQALGLGKDPHVEWMIEAFGAKPGKNVVNRLYQGAPKLCRWEGDLRGTPVSFHTNPGNMYRGAGGFYLGDAGPQFMGEVSEYRCIFFRPREAPLFTMDDPRWPGLARKAAGDPEWSESFPEEIFERGLGVGTFAMELDCPLDARPLFPILRELRESLEAMSDAVETVLLYAAGVGVGFSVPLLTREKLLSDAEKGLEILRRSTAVG